MNAYMLDAPIDAYIQSYTSGKSRFVFLDGLDARIRTTLTELKAGMLKQSPDDKW